MRSGIWTILYVLALLTSAIATFGVGGWKAAAAVIAFWGAIFYSKKPVVALACLLVILGLLVALLLPDIQSAREASPRNSCINNLKQISLALHGYHDVYGCFPPAYIADENGKPMHSWRVLILPYMEETTVYDAYDFNEPWDKQSDSRLAAVSIDTFRCPSATTPDTHTNYLAVVGPRTAWPNGKSSRLDDFGDGTANTLLLIESHQHSVHWMEPRDISFDEAVEMLSGDVGWDDRDGCIEELFLCYSSVGRTVAFADSHIEWLPYDISRKLAEALLTRSGLENIDLESIKFSGSTIRTMKWDRVCLLSVFIALALLPAPWAWRARAKRDPGDA